MTSLNIEIPDFSTPTKLVEVEKYCRGCDECWPITHEFWGKNGGKSDGLQPICKACEADKRRGMACAIEPETQSKACSCCKKIKPLTEACWVRREGYGDGFENQCRVCRNAARAKRDARKRAGIPKELPFVVTPRTKFKICACCGEDKPLHARFWHRHPHTKDGFTKACKVCANAARKLRNAMPGQPVVMEYRFGTPSTRPNKQPKRRHTGVFTEKSCNACLQYKALTDEFWYKSKANTDGFMTRCKLCECAAQKEARRKRREEKLAA